MEPEQLKEIENRLDEIERVLRHSDETWVERNLPLVVQTLVLIVAFAGAWVRMEMKIIAIQDYQDRLQVEITNDETAIRQHHEDTAKHVDSSWKADVRSDLNSIRNLLIEHMSDGRKTNK